MAPDLDRYIACLPQRPPFLFLDAVEALEPQRQAVGRVTFPAGHRIFENHLPDEPLVPAVILIEALAQLSGLLLIPDAGTPVRGYLAEVQRVRFRRLIRPDEPITLRARLERRLGSAARFEVSAAVGTEEAAAGIITLGGMRA